MTYVDRILERVEQLPSWKKTLAQFVAGVVIIILVVWSLNANAQAFDSLNDARQSGLVTICTTETQAVVVLRLRQHGISWNQATDAVNQAYGDKVCIIRTMEYRIHSLLRRMIVAGTSWDVRFVDTIALKVGDRWAIQLKMPSGYALIESAFWDI